jgi:ERO1-like protein beta
MPSAARVFYLAVFALLGTTCHGKGPSDGAVQQKNGPNVCAVSSRSSPSPTNSTIASVATAYTIPLHQYEPNSIVSDACASYSHLDKINEGLTPYLRSITQHTDFFSHFRLNLYNKKCPYWTDDNGVCGNYACAVITLENEEDIPPVWRAESLGRLEGPKAQHPGKRLQEQRPAERPLQGELGDDVGESCVVEYDDECDERDYCVPEDERATSKGDYVSLVDNPERFTGYSGAGARQVWEAIYRENCFGKPPKEFSPAPSLSQPIGSPFQMQAAQDLRVIMKEHSVQQGVQQAIAQGSEHSSIDELEFDQECLEKRVFYRVVSGMHASISTHLCFDFLNQTTGQWAPNIECYRSRLHEHPERISNMYFNYALLLRAVGKLKGHLKDYTFCSADPTQDKETKNLVTQLSQSISDSGEIFDESVMFQSPDSAGLKEDFKQSFRNISRIMDCVGCDKCRLWGKVQTNGYGTALKILFEFDEVNPENDPILRRTELVALINTLNRVSNSLNAVKYFRSVVEIQDSQTGENESRPVEETEPVNDGLPESHKELEDEPTVWEIIQEEVSLVTRAYVFVLKSWIEFPYKLWLILRYEGSRFWYMFLGFTPGEREWGFRFPGHDEL